MKGAVSKSTYSLILVFLGLFSNGCLEPKNQGEKEQIKCPNELIEYLKSEKKILKDQFGQVIIELNDKQAIEVLRYNWKILFERVLGMLYENDNRIKLCKETNDPNELFDAMVATNENLLAVIYFEGKVIDGKVNANEYKTALEIITQLELTISDSIDKIIQTAESNVKYLE